MVTFKATIKIRGINPYILVNAKRAESIKPSNTLWRKPMPVLIQVNSKPSKPWPINMIPVGDGSYYLYLHETVRNASRTKVGDIVTVQIKFNEMYHNGPQHEMPKWFAKPLFMNKIALHTWNNLSPSRQKEMLRYFDGLKTLEAQKRNAKRAIEVLSGSGGRFMARDW